MVILTTEELNAYEGRPTRMTSVGLSDLAPHALPMRNGAMRHERC